MDADPGAGVTTYSDVAPPDRADHNPLDAAFRALLGALSSTLNRRPSVTVLLGKDEWDKARTYYQRPYRGRPSEFGVYLDCGTVWVEPADDGPVVQTPREGAIREARCARCACVVVWVRGGWACSHCAPEDDREAAIDAAARAGISIEPAKSPSACGARTFGGDVCALPAGHQPGVDHGPNATGERPPPTATPFAPGVGACIETACPSSPLIIPPLAPIDRDAVDARSTEVALATLGGANAQPADSVVEYGGPWKGDGA